MRIPARRPARIRGYAAAKTISAVSGMRPLTRCWAAVVPDSGCRKLSSSTWRAIAAMPPTASFVSQLLVRIQEDKGRRVVAFASSAVGSWVSEPVIVFLLLPGCLRQTDGVVASAMTRLLLGVAM